LTARSRRDPMPPPKKNSPEEESRRAAIAARLAAFLEQKRAEHHANRAAARCPPVTALIRNSPNVRPLTAFFPGRRMCQCGWLYSYF